MRYHCVEREIHTKHYIVEAQNVGDAEVILHNGKREDEKNITKLPEEEHGFGYKALHILKNKKWEPVKECKSWPNNTEDVFLKKKKYKNLFKRVLLSLRRLTD